MESQHSILFWISSLPFAGLDGRLPFFADSRINNRKLSVFCCCTLLAPSPLSQSQKENIYCQFSWVIFMKILIVIALAILIRWSWVGADNLLRRRSSNSFTKFSFYLFLIFYFNLCTISSRSYPFFFMLICIFWCLRPKNGGRRASVAVSLVTTDHPPLADSAEDRVISLTTLYLIKKFYSWNLASTEHKGKGRSTKYPVQIHWDVWILGEELLFGVKN